MKQISDLLPNPESLTPNGLAEHSESKSNQAANLDEQIVLRIFAYLQAKYTHKWSSQVPDAEMMELMKACWAEDLRGLPNEAIRQALVSCTREYPEWPPTVGQFRELCMVGRDPITIPPERQLDKPRDEKLALDSLAEMKKILGFK